MQSDLTEQILNLKDGDHLCLFYEKDPAEQMPALVPFIQDGLSKDEQFIYIADDQTVEELAARLEQSGINVAKEADRGALKLWSRQEWRQRGKLSAQKKSQQVLEFIKKAKESGFKGSRFAVEMTWTLGPDIRASELERWEATINTIFVPGFPGRITCQYNRSRLSPEVLVAAFHTHPLAVLGNQVFPNWFYEAPLILDGKSAAARVDWMISIMERSRTAQKEREELIQKRTALAEAEKSKRELTACFEAANIPLHWAGSDGIIQWANTAELAMLGYTKEEYEGQHIAKFHVDKEAIEDILTRLTRGEKISNYPARLRRKDGSIRDVMIGSIVLWEEGRFIHTQCFTRDVTESKRAEEASQRLAAIIESSEDAIVSKDLNGIITSWNQGAERIFGYKAHEVIGKPISILIPAEAQNEEPAILERIRRGERIDHYETIRRRKDGALINISLTVSPIKTANGAILGASKIARDITERKQTEAALRQARDELTRLNEELEKRVRERTVELEQANAALLREMEEQKRLEEQLRHAQKMESVGTLAGGIAHDFNNILNIIKGYATLAGRYSSGDERNSDSIKVIDESIERGAALVRQMLTLARKTEAHLASTNANDLISDLCKILKQTFPKTITISLELNSKLPPVMADPNQISQVLLNLGVNARDAMPSGGRLTFKTRMVEGSKVRGAGDTAPETQEYACIEVCDTGIGMDDGVRRRIFEPFFTTKGIGEGTGLGLAMVYGIIKNHNGFIDVESEPGHGTTFRLYLPLPESEQARPSEETGNGTGASCVDGYGTVLIVEDEENMVRLLRDVLEDRRYHVLAALDGAEAIDVYRRHKDKIDVVLLDIGLPKIAGWDVILNMKEENPDVNVLVASGYIEPEFKSRMYAAGVKGFIYKPYLPDDIVQTIQGLITAS
jgi:two-component system, cell cycle sensor histidine kinase and response regulator CckA